MSNENSYSDCLENIKYHFSNLFEICNKTWMWGCGSYLFDGKNYDYCPEMLEKQELIFNKAKNISSGLEIGTYMGHSLLIMLAANPNIKMTCIDIDHRFSKPATDYLQKQFPSSNITFINDSSLNVLPTLKDKFDLFHIDGEHLNSIITQEFNYCKQLSSTNQMKVIFDDAEVCEQLIHKIETDYEVVEKIRPTCLAYNAYLEIKI